MAVIRIHYGDDELTVEIDDDGRGAIATTNGGGNGIAGMRERATTLGGTLEAGLRPGRGFRVRKRSVRRGRSWKRPKMKWSSPTCVWSWILPSTTMGGA